MFRNRPAYGAVRSSFISAVSQKRPPSPRQRQQSTVARRARHRRPRKDHRYLWIHTYRSLPCPSYKLLPSRQGKLCSNVRSHVATGRVSANRLATCKRGELDAVHVVRGRRKGIRIKVVGHQPTSLLIHHENGCIMKPCPRTLGHQRLLLWPPDGSSPRQKMAFSSGYCFAFSFSTCGPRLVSAPSGLTSAWRSNPRRNRSREISVEGVATRL
jgi:hypothetical protein